MSGKLSRKQAAALITAVETTAKGMSTNEKKNSPMTKELIADTMKTSDSFKGIDAEGIHDLFSTDVGICREKSASEVDGMKVTQLGKQRYTPESIDLLDNTDFESFDRLNTQNNITLRLGALNLAANNLSTKDDGIIDLFTVAEVGANETGKKIIASNPMITHGAKNINGVAVGGSKIPLISNLYNANVFTAGRLPLHPLLRSSGDYPTDDSLQGLVTDTVTVAGERSVTSPILVGTSVNLRTLCATGSYLQEFGAAVNPNVTLSEEGYLKEVFIKAKDTADVVNLLKFAVKGESGTRFNTTNSGNGKDTVVTYASKLKIKTSDIISNKQLAYTSTAGTVVAPLATPGIVVNLSFTINLNANTDTMLLSSSATTINVVSVIKDGVTLADTASEVVAIKELFKTATVDSFYPELYQSNTNNTDNGIIVDVEENMYEIPAVIKAPVTFRKSVLGDVPADQLAGYLVAANVTSASMLAAEALEVIQECIAINTPKLENGFIVGANLDGIGANYIKPMIVKETIEATGRITMKSSEVKDDISKLIYDTITATGIRVYTDSNFDKAVDTLAVGEKVTLQLIGDRETIHYINHAMEKSPQDKTSFEVATSVSTKIKNKVYATFKLKDVYEFSPFILVKAPNFIYRGTELAGNSGNQDTCKYVPRRNIMVNVPLIMEFDVSDIVNAFKRI